MRPRGPTEEGLNRLLERNLSLRTDDGLTARERIPGALAGWVGPGLENHPDDVATVGAVLRQLGHIPPGAELPLFTGSVFDGLKSFQRQSGLARDAVVNPDGPTERALAETLMSNLQRDPAFRAQLAQLERPTPPAPRRKPDNDHSASEKPHRSRHANPLRVRRFLGANPCRPSRIQTLAASSRNSI